MVVTWRLQIRPLDFAKLAAVSHAGYVQRPIMHSYHELLVESVPLLRSCVAPAIGDIRVDKQTSQRRTVAYVVPCLVDHVPVRAPETVSAHLHQGGEGGVAVPDVT